MQDSMISLITLWSAIAAAMPTIGAILTFLWKIYKKQKQMDNLQNAKIAQIEKLNLLLFKLQKHIIQTNNIYWQNNGLHEDTKKILQEHTQVMVKQIEELETYYQEQNKTFS